MSKMRMQPSLKRYDQKIILCPNCKGEGRICVDELVDYHKGIYDTECEDCFYCEGKGRVLEKTTIKYEVLK